MKSHLTTILLAAAALTSIAAAQSPSAPPASLSADLRLERYAEPAFPSQFRNKSITNGYAQVQLLVAADGRILETFVSAYSHVEFAAAVEAAIKEWAFRPADGAAAGALPQRYNVRFNFRREGMIIVQGDPQETVRAFLGQKDTGANVEVCKLRDLDNTPEAVNLVVPTYPEELKKQRVEGGAAVAFFIDEEGQVRVPSIAGSTHPEFAAAALEAVSKWTFVPPSRKGKPTRVFAVQEFSFNPETAAVSSKVTK